MLSASPSFAAAAAPSANGDRSHHASRNGGHDADAGPAGDTAAVMVRGDAAGARAAAALAAAKWPSAPLLAVWLVVLLLAAVVREPDTAAPASMPPRVAPAPPPPLRARAPRDDGSRRGSGGALDAGFCTGLDDDAASAAPPPTPRWRLRAGTDDDGASTFVSLLGECDVCE